MNPPPDITAPGAPRPVQPVQLIALDLDGTCVDMEQRLHPRIRDAVHGTVAAGVIVVVATGRMYCSALPWARELHVLAPLICYQGAVVRAMPGPSAPIVAGIPLGEIVAEHIVEGGTALRALREARANGWHVQAYQNEQLLCEQDRPEAHLYARIAQVRPTFVDDLEPLLHHGTVKVVCVVCDPTEAQRCEDGMRTLLRDEARVTRSLPEFVEMTNPLASKRQALERLCTHLGVDIACTAAVGDAPNDIDMLAGAGFSVSVHTRDARLLAAADAVCSGPEQGGVADVLEALVPGLRSRRSTRAASRRPPPSKP